MKNGKKWYSIRTVNGSLFIVDALNHAKAKLEALTFGIIPLMCIELGGLEPDQINAYINQGYRQIINLKPSKNKKS